MVHTEIKEEAGNPALNTHEMEQEGSGTYRNKKEAGNLALNTHEMGKV